MLCHAVLQVSPLLRILITRSVALVPALTVALLTRNSSESTGLDTLNQWLNLVRQPEGGFLGGGSRLQTLQIAKERQVPTCRIRHLLVLHCFVPLLAFLEACGSHCWSGQVGS